MFFHIVKPNFKDIRLLSIVCLYKTHNIDSITLHHKWREFSFEILHDQLPLAVPCYDLVFVIELTVSRRNVGIRVLPTPLTWRADFVFWNITSSHVASGFPALRESDINIGFVLQHTMIYHSASTTTQLTSHVYKFPLTHEISLGHLSFFSGHYDLGFCWRFPMTHHTGRIPIFMIALSFVTRILQSTPYGWRPTRSLFPYFLWKVGL